MFDEYENLPKNYIPNNMITVPKSIDLVLSNNNLGIIYDNHKNVIQYSWNYGDTVNLPISPFIHINVYPRDIICEIPGQVPSKYYDLCEIGTRYYNTVDMKSWKNELVVYNPFSYLPLEEEPYNFKTHYFLYSYKDGYDFKPLTEPVEYELGKYYIQDNSVVWVEDKALTYPSDGVTPITLKPSMANKKYIISITNFRHEIIKETTFENIEGDFNYNINEEFSLKLLPGIYYMDIVLVDDMNVRNHISTKQLHVTGICVDKTFTEKNKED